MFDMANLYYPFGERSHTMTTAAQMPDLTGLDKVQQLDALRRMATIPGRRDHAPDETEMTLSVDATATRLHTVEPAP